MEESMLLPFKRPIRPTECHVVPQVNLRQMCKHNYVMVNLVHRNYWTPRNLLPLFKEDNIFPAFFTKVKRYGWTDDTSATYNNFCIFRKRTCLTWSGEKSELKKAMTNGKYGPWRNIIHRHASSLSLKSTENDFKHTELEKRLTKYIQNVRLHETANWTNWRIESEIVNWS